MDPSFSGAPKPLSPPTAAPGTLDDEEGHTGPDTQLLTGSTAAASAAQPRSNAYSGSSLKEQPGVSAYQDAQINAPFNTHHSRAGHSLVDRLQPSGASQSSSAPTHGISQSGASSVGLQNPEPPSSSGDSNAGNSSVKAQSVGRVGLESLGGLAWQLEGSDAEVEKQIYVAVFQLKAMIRDSRCAAMVSVPAGVPIPVGQIDGQLREMKHPNKLNVDSFNMSRHCTTHCMCIHSNAGYAPQH